MTSTNALTKRYCEMKGWLWANTQHHYGGRRHDLFGIADALVVPSVTERLIFVQNCCYGSRPEHRRTIDALPYVGSLMTAGAWIELWEWKRKKIGRKYHWFLRIQARNWTGWGEERAWEGPHDL